VLDVAAAWLSDDPRRIARNGGQLFADASYSRQIAVALYRSKLISLLRRIDDYLVRWAMKKYKRLRGHPPRARRMLASVHQREPALFAHWQRGHAAHGRMTRAR